MPINCPKYRGRGMLIIFKSLICKSQYPMASCFSHHSGSIREFFLKKKKTVVKQCFFFFWPRFLLFKNSGYQCKAVLFFLAIYRQIAKCDSDLAKLTNESTFFTDLAASTSYWVMLQILLQPLSAPHFLFQYFSYRHKCTKFSLMIMACLIFYISIKKNSETKGKGD
jgi:hypothetical protein